MDCTALRQSIYDFLNGELPPEEARALQQHGQACPSCAEVLHGEEAMSRFLHERLRRPEPAPAALRSRLQDALRAGASAGRAVPAERNRWREILASPWTPRLAMAIVFAVILLVPLARLRTPAVVEAAVVRYECHHLDLTQPLPACCHDLGAGVGDSLGEPSPGAVVPDLTTRGFQFVMATRCAYADHTINLLAYKDAQGRPFYLYLTDHEAREFKLLRTHEVGGISMARYRVRERDVAVWQRGNLVCYWVGARDGAGFEAGLARLLQPY